MEAEQVQELLDQKVEKKLIDYGYVVEIGYHSFKFNNAFTASRFMADAVRGILRNGDYRISSMGYIDDISMKPIVFEDEDEDAEDVEDVEED